jgi:small subunit ribosomal protein S20
MANIRSQIKRNRTNERRRVRNRAVKSELRTRVKTALTTAGTEGAGDESLRLALKKIDKAASKGVIHKNAAARRKSRLMRAVARSTSA